MAVDQHVARVIEAKEPNDHDESFLTQVSQNRIGLVGFLLSFAQLAVHGSWMLFAAWLSASGQADGLATDAWQMWAITVAMILGTALTMVSLFLCLYGSLYGRPKALAYAGLCISFFVGVFTTFALVISAITRSS